jgi:uncharacterized protein YlaI
MINGFASCGDKGKYLGKVLNEIPVKALLKVYFNNEYRNNPSMFQFAKDNLDELLEMAKTYYVEEPKELKENDCLKIKYISKKVANSEMKRIQEHIANGYKPIRSYYCDNCSMWHLTSKTNAQLEKYESR